MAKANAPLFSLKASGKLGDALVYFNWKGINCVRSYVIPANPQSTAQLAQRNHMINAVLNWHLTSHSALDRQAWSNWATAIVATLTGFKCWYGLSPTSMINSVECTGDDTGWIAEITGLATKTKYYLQWEGTAPDSMNTAKSGIYTETTT